MILILSTETLDMSTEQIIDWLDYYKRDFIRINGEAMNGTNPYSLSINEHCETVAEEGLIGLDVDKVNVIWYRRWNRYHHLDFLKKLSSSRSAIELYMHMNKELTATSNSFFLSLKDKNWIDNPKNVKLSKIETLLLAKKAGLLIPETLITNSKDRLKKFASLNGRIISKPIVDGGSLHMEDKNFILYTHEVMDSELDLLPANFYPSLFQKLIEKKIEIRAFYLDGKCYSMAIFSQSNDLTMVDFRIYDSKRPNRNVPFNLPKDISEKIDVLMKKLCLTTGSIDLVLSEDNKYYFLEVNPIGQFGMVSFPCNYNLEKKLAEYLILKDETLYNTN